MAGSLGAEEGCHGRQQVHVKCELTYLVSKEGAQVMRVNIWAVVYDWICGSFVGAVSFTMFLDAFGLGNANLAALLCQWLL